MTIHAIGDPGWYVEQFGTQKSYREMLFGPWPDEPWELPTWRDHPDGRLT